MWRVPQLPAPWRQSYDPAHHWLLSALWAALPLIVLLVAMAVLHIKGHLAALAGVAAALVIALAVFQMPMRLALLASGLGAAYGLFPVCWIVFPVLFLYQLTVRAGRFTLLQECLTGVTPDSRLQLLLIAFAFGAFFEGTGGFGAPVAVCGSILIGLGFSPLEAAGLSLLANTAPVAFGALGIPIVALHGVTGLDTLVLSRVIGRLLAPFCVLIPFWLICAFAGFRAMIEVWPAILVAGATYGVTLLLISTFHGPWLADIAASTLTICALIAFFRLWKPKRILNPARQEVTHIPLTTSIPSAAVIRRAIMPWVVLALCVVFWGVPYFAQWIDSATTMLIPIHGLHQMVLRMPPAVTSPAAEPAIFNLNLLSATGTGIFVAGILAGFFMRLQLRDIADVFLQTLISMRFTIITISALMAIGFLARYSGMDATLGLAFARTGAFYPFFGTLIGWLGTASTGSDTSSNVLFGSLQKLTAQQLGISPYLMTSANSTGGVMGKMIAPQSIVVATTATNQYGSEGTILRFVFLHSLALACLMGLLVSLVAHWPLLTRLFLY
ncbi:lactate permease [Edaphobacter aggregans]|uniref:L-lactate permease n=1 Tax=Edaphobacter aggregans TaxID=570835 RepID=A0A428MHC6_9BACT|nr:L-lactate permease [Edaphobacter aggregans]RSL16324.1 lactate permease [Edaphobacter aggregans]